MAILTKKQKAVLDYITTYEQDYGYAPSLNEIKEALGASAVSTIHEHVTNLITKGFLKRVKGAARSLELVKMKLASSLSIPLVGTIACGEPLEALEESDRSIEISSDTRFNVSDLYALRAKGDSMIEDGILEGDYLIIKKQAWASNGDTVVAIIDDNEATLKQFYKEKDRIRLQPANSNYEPIFRKEVEVRGVVIKVIRDLARV
ncbi:MAG: transcriptional repressor LexA [Patescibacteria group bacterium]|jgi:repressor LexA|nr:transcriptional repressor LexA [Patescibacteria group bacterium]